jgi:tRNA modification GTPase
MPNINNEDTIAAIATPIGEGGISVIRISGADCFSLVEKIFVPKKGNISDFLSHTLHLGDIRDNDGQIKDQVLISLFRAPHSYTGENIIEISSHGGLIVTRKILDLLISNGARHAEPGEFTKRAFLNGRIDLTQAEAVLDLIKAKSDKSLEVAIKQLTGALSHRLKTIKNDLMKIYAHIEAFLDFPDEHLEVYSDQQLLGKLNTTKKEIEDLAASFNRGNLFREGITAVLVGKPNVGKSSLFNALLERDRALVSEYPGTTRDILEEAIEIDGLYIRLLDTAGLSSAPEHPVEQMGMARTKQAIQTAHLFLYIVDGAAPLDKADTLAFKEIPANKPMMVLLNKSDLPIRVSREDVKQLTAQADFLEISSKNRKGLDLLEKTILEKVMGKNIEAPGEQITRLRHKNALEQSAQALSRAKEALEREESLEFVSEDLKIALDSLRELVGEIYSEDLLDVIFSEFCIGK